jgi:hypothetical protein
MASKLDNVLRMPSQNALQSGGFGALGGGIRPWGGRPPNPWATPQPPMVTDNLDNPDEPEDPPTTPDTPRQPDDPPTTTHNPDAPPTSTRNPDDLPTNTDHHRQPTTTHDKTRQTLTTRATPDDPQRARRQRYAGWRHPVVGVDSRGLHRPATQNCTRQPRPPSRKLYRDRHPP